MSAPDAISAALTVDPTAIVDETPTVAPKSKRTCNTWTNRESTVFFEAAVVVGRRSACQPSCTAPEKRHGNRDTSAMIAIVDGSPYFLFSAWSGVEQDWRQARSQNPRPDPSLLLPQLAQDQGPAGQRYVGNVITYVGNSCAHSLDNRRPSGERSRRRAPVCPLLAVPYRPCPRLALPMPCPECLGCGLPDLPVGCVVTVPCLCRGYFDHALPMSCPCLPCLQCHSVSELSLRVCNVTMCLNC